MDEINASDELTPKGKRAQLLAARDAITKEIAQWSMKYEAVFTRLVNDAQETINKELAKRTYTPSDASVSAMAARLAGFSAEEVSTLYKTGDAKAQALISAAVALTGNLIPERNPKPGFPPTWKPAISPDVKAEVAARRNEEASPEAKRNLDYLSFTKDAYRAIGTAAVRTVEKALAETGAATQGAPITDASGQSIVVPIRAH